jgi:streptogramin lyase
MSQDDSGRHGEGTRLPRRLLLKTLAAGTVLLEPGCGSDSLEGDAAVIKHDINPAHELESPIKIENRLRGTSAYTLTRPALTNEVEGYASDSSVAAGETLRIYVSVSRAQGVRADVYRIGYYQALGARLVKSLARVAVSPQPIPTADSNTGLVECEWQSAFELLIEASFTNGYYLCKLTNDDGMQSYVPFIVRESGRLAPLLVKASVTTWQAYNRWGGVSLYINELPDSVGFESARGFQVSFDRPYAPGTDIGWIEYAFIRFLEQNGYDIGYVTNIDLDRSPELLNNRRLFATCGHDEYWSLTERNAVQSARDAGLCLAFFSGNTGYRRIRLDSSSSGAARRVITCYKSGSLDPVGNALDTTADAESAPNRRPENEIMGVLWAGWANLRGFPCLISNPDHWIYEGTGVKANDSLGHIVGCEWDVVSNNSVSPANLEVVTDSPVLHEYGFVSRATSTVYYPTATSFVFAAGTISWGEALSGPAVVEPRLQRVTENILARAGVFPEAIVEVLAQPSGEAGTSDRSLIIAGSGVAGSKNGPPFSAEFYAPGGVAAGPNGELYVCDTGNNLVRKIAADGQVTTVAGTRARGQPVLGTPTGIVVDQSGVVYFSDTDGHRIFYLEPDGTAKIFAGSSQGFSDNSNPREANFNMPRGLAMAPSGALYVADFRNDAIRRIDDSGVTTVISHAGGPTALAVAADGTIYYVATWSGCIVRVSTDGSSTTIANPNQVYGDQSGPGAAAALRPGDGLCLTELGLVFSDTANNRIRGLLFDEQNTVWTLLGNGEAGTAVGSGAATQLNLPRGLTPFNGGFAVADCANHRILWFAV